MKKIKSEQEDFDGFLEKGKSATTQAQKEKFSESMKGSISRLQRHRNRLKTWIDDPKIKDKSQLEEEKLKIQEVCFI